jgi:hypothetical protein
MAEPGVYLKEIMTRPLRGGGVYGWALDGEPSPLAVMAQSFSPKKRTASHKELSVGSSGSEECWG